MLNRKQKAIRLLKEKKTKEAMQLLEELLSDEPNDTFILYNLGICLSELGNYRESINTLEKCIMLNEKNSNAYVALGFSYFKEGIVKKAKEALLKALELDPENVYALLNLGGVYASTKDYVSAVNTFKKAERIDPENPKILYGLALVYKNVEDFYKASQYFKKIVNLGKEDELVELSKDQLREIAELEFRKHGIRMDAVMYCLSASKKFANMPKVKILEVLSEISNLGQSGLDTNEPAQKYTLKSLPGSYSGLNLVCYLYVGTKIINPDLDIGFDISKEYNIAMKLLENTENE